MKSFFQTAGVVGLALLTGCSTQVKTPSDLPMPPSPVSVKAADIAEGDEVVYPPVTNNPSISINCPFTNGYVYLSVSSDLINWQPLDGTIYNASLPRDDSSITNFYDPNIPFRFAMYAQTNWTEAVPPP